MLDPFEVFKIEKHSITCKYDTNIIIDTKQYEINKTLIETTNEYILPGIISSYIPKLNDVCNFMTNYNIKLIKPINISTEKYIITLHYNKDETIVEQTNYIDEIDVPLIIKLLEGRALFINNPQKLYNLVSSQINYIDSVHIELILSNMFRSNSDVRVKCRHTGKFEDCRIIGQTAQPFLDSWYSSIAFQYIDKGITEGLISGNKAIKNPIERILSYEYDNI